MMGRALVASSSAIFLALGPWPSPRLQATGPGVRTGQQTKEFHVVARRYTFNPIRLEVNHW
jgi:hypothetical protein